MFSSNSYRKRCRKQNEQLFCIFKLENCLRPPLSNAKIQKTSEFKFKTVLLSQFIQANLKLKKMSHFFVKANSLAMSKKRSIGQMNEFVLEVKKTGDILKKRGGRE